MQPLPAGSLHGSFRIDALVGAGGMGEVYRAHDTRLQRRVALKFLPDRFAADPDRLARFEREAQVLASLNHPHIAQIYGVEESGGLRALVMELVDGRTLAERLADRSAPMRVDEALAVGRQIADALDAAHEKGVVHRDLKPANVMIAEDDRVKVLDFGLAKLASGDRAGGVAAGIDQTQSPTMLTMTGTRDGLLLGTVAYMSPEQARGRAVDKRTDTWAFGCVLYEMLAGRAAFEGETPSDTIARILERDPDWSALPAATPSSVRRLLRRCLEKDPRRRLRDIGDARHDLEDEADAPGNGIAAARPRTRAIWLAATALALTALAAIAAVAWQLRSGDPRPVRLSVVAPPGTSFAWRDITEHPQFALSPDGTQLALVAAARGEPARIWVRSLETGTAQPLAGTEGASGPFWSPDGREIGFHAQGKLRKIAVDGGRAVDLYDVAFDVSNGAWSPDGIILITRGAGGALARLSASGGSAVPATTLDQARRETVHRWPQFLPDGRRFIAFVASTLPDQSGIYLGSIDSAELTRVLPSATGAVFAEPASLLFEQNGRLMRQRFEPGTGTLTGEAQSLGDPILGLRGPAYLPLSAARNGTLAYWTARLSPSELRWFDRAGRPLERVGNATIRHDNPVLSRDGTKVLATLRETSNENEIWRYDLATGVSSRMTFTRGVARFPIWAPDGQTIAFSSPNEEGAQILQRAASGAGQETRVDRPGRQHYAVFPDDWSHDGRWLVYVVVSETAFDVWALDLQEQQAAAVLESPANEVQPRLSPNGRWLAYASDETGVWEVYVQGFGSTRGKWQVSVGGGSQPMWRGDGRELYYVDPDGGLMAIAVGSSEAFETKPPQRLFQTSLPPMLAPFRTSYAVSADGQRFLINTLLPDREPPTITVVLNWNADLDP